MSEISNFNTYMGRTAIYISTVISTCRCSTCQNYHAIALHKSKYNKQLWTVVSEVRINIIYSYSLTNIMLRSWCTMTYHNTYGGWLQNMFYLKILLHGHQSIDVKRNWKSSDSLIREKGRDLTQSYDKSPYTNRNVKRAKWQHKQRHKKVRLNSGCGPT